MRKPKWVCGRDIKIAVFYLPCTCFGGNISRTKQGVTYLGHLSEKIKKRVMSFIHLQNEKLTSKYLISYIGPSYFVRHYKKSNLH